MLSKEMEKALNNQINAEMWSAYLYLSMSADFAAKGMAGMANWTHIQFKEEQDHALKFFNYIVSRGGRPILQPIQAVKTSWESADEVFKEVLDHEHKVTAMINGLATLATKETDYASQSFLQWFIDEQVEEEDSCQKIIDALKMINGNGYGLYQLDKELATRVYTPIVI